MLSEGVRKKSVVIAKKNTHVISSMLDDLHESRLGIFYGVGVANMKETPEDS